MGRDKDIITSSVPLLSKPLTIYGAGGHGKVVAEAAQAAGYGPISFIDDLLTGKSVLGIRVGARTPEILRDIIGRHIIIAVGDISARERLFEEFVHSGAALATVRHPFSWISPSAAIGHGTFVGGGAIINAETVIGKNCIINTSASVDHDCDIGDHSHICPGARLAGNVTVGRRTLIGTGASVIPGIRIGESCVIGAGSVVVKDIMDNTLAYGVPAQSAEVPLSL